MNTLIRVAEVDALNKPKIFDCRYSLADESYGRLAYDKSHIPGAIYVDLNRDLSGRIIPGRTGRHPLPLLAQFEASVQQWGLDNEQQVVAYDDSNGAYAARLWWMLRWLGHSNVAVLDGGFSAWNNKERRFAPHLFQVSEGGVYARALAPKGVDGPCR